LIEKSIYIFKLKSIIRFMVEMFLTTALREQGLGDEDEQIHKSYESEMEQSEFRRQLLNEIRILCDQSEDLCDDILIAIDSSPARLWEEPVADGE